MQITSLTNNEIYDSSNKTSSVEKTKSDDFESLISSTKSVFLTTSLGFNLLCVRTFSCLLDSSFSILKVSFSHLSSA